MRFKAELGDRKGGRPKDILLFLCELKTKMMPTNAKNTFHNTYFTVKGPDQLLLHILGSKEACVTGRVVSGQQVGGEVHLESHLVADAVRVSFVSLLTAITVIHCEWYYGTEISQWTQNWFPYSPEDNFEDALNPVIPVGLFV